MLNNEEDIIKVLSDPNKIKEIVSEDAELFEDLLAKLDDDAKKRFLHYKPYSKQLEFHNSLATERILSGANQSGKTLAGAMETNFHITGRYPEWWQGHRITPRINAANGDKEINIWVIGTDSKTVRDSLQTKIIGTQARGFRDGCIHPDYIDMDSVIMSRGVQGLVDTIYLKHVSGARTRLQFRSYEQGRENLQSATIDAVYCDEEPPSDIIGELRARLGATDGFMYMAFTPLKGMTPLVQEFWNHDNPDKFLVCMNVYEASHYTPEKIKKIESLYSGLSESERKARMLGVPTMGSGMIYPVDDEELKFDFMGEDNIPNDWLRIGGFDFGRGDHPQAMVWGMLNPHTDILYIYDAIKTTNKSVAENASLMRKRGAWIPFAWPHDLMRETGVSDPRKSEGYKYKELYEQEGIRLTPTNAKDKNGSIKVENGIIEIRRRMAEGKFKVARHLSEWFKEKQVYRYGDDGKPVKEKDDLMDATRYLTIMLRYAKSKYDSLLEENPYSLLTGNNNNKCVDDTPIY